MRHEAVQVNGPALNREDALGFIEPGQDARQRCFARSVCTDQRRNPCGNRKTHVAEDGLLSAFIRKGDVFGRKKARRHGPVSQCRRNARQGRAEILHLGLAKPVKSAHILIVKNRERAPNRHRSGLHDEDLINQAFKPVKTMVDHENGSALGFEFTEDAGKRHCGFRIQIGARLIENERFGAERENRGESDLLLLPFRELVNVLREKMFNPHALGSTVYAGTDFFKRHAAAFEREGDLIAHIEREELLFGILEKRADML